MHLRVSKVYTRTYPARARHQEPFSAPPFSVGCAPWTPAILRTALPKLVGDVCPPQRHDRSHLKAGASRLRGVYLRQHWMPPPDA